MAGRTDRKKLRYALDSRQDDQVQQQQNSDGSIGVHLLQQLSREIITHYDLWIIANRQEFQILTGNKKVLYRNQNIINQIEKLE